MHQTGARPAEDELERDRAVKSDEALIAYHRKWQCRVARLQGSYPGRWRVPGLSAEEVQDALTLRLIEVVRGDPAAHALYQNEHKEWGLAVMQQHLRLLRKSFRLDATPTDFAAEVVRERDPSQEERWLELESDTCRRLAAEKAQQHLSRPQRRWLAALKLSANCGEFFAASNEPNLSAASRVLQKHRSSAQRAYRELQSQFRKQLEHLE